MFIYDADQGAIWCDKRNPKKEENPSKKSLHYSKISLSDYGNKSNSKKKRMMRKKNFFFFLFRLRIFFFFQTTRIYIRRNFRDYFPALSCKQLFGPSQSAFQMALLEKRRRRRRRRKVSLMMETISAPRFCWSSAIFAQWSGAIDAVSMIEKRVLSLYYPSIPSRPTFFFSFFHPHFSPKCFDCRSRCSPHLTTPDLTDGTRAKFDLLKSTPHWLSGKHKHVAQIKKKRTTNKRKPRLYK